MLRPEHIVIIIVVALIIFGYNRLPGAVRSIGQAIREFKKEVTQGDEIKKAD
jgi:sec-independent protein translocase protein TatA